MNPHNRLIYVNFFKEEFLLWTWVKHLFSQALQSVQVWQ